MQAIIAATQETGFASSLVLAAVLLGLRHGIDWDHIAAISDIAASNDTRGGLRLGTLYAVGHGCVVFVLGVVALMVGSRIPPGFDDLMGRVAGVTLLVLAATVVHSVSRERGSFRMQSRWLLLIVAARRASRRVGALGRGSRARIEHTHAHVDIEGFHHQIDGSAAPSRSIPAGAGDRLTAPTHHHAHAHDEGWDQSSDRFAFGIGMLHGVGAETPTQVVLFLAAANAGGTTTGIAILVAFISGLLLSNSAITVFGVSGFRQVASRPSVHLVMAAITTIVSVAVGTSLLMGIQPATI